MPEEILRLLLGGVGWGLGTLFAGQGDKLIDFVITNNKSKSKNGLGRLEPSINIENTLETMGSCLNHHLEQVCLGGDHALVIDGHNLHLALSTSVELFLTQAGQAVQLCARLPPVDQMAF